jgi:hypothetical protein
VPENPLTLPPRVAPTPQTPIETTIKPKVFTKPTTASTTAMETPTTSAINPDEIFVPSNDFLIDFRSSLIEEERKGEGLKGNAPIQTCLEMAQEGLMPLLPGLKIQKVLFTKSL